MAITVGSVPVLAYDGGQIDVLWDNHEQAVEWYCQYLGWQHGQSMNGRTDPQSREEKMTSVGWGHGSSRC